MTSIWNTLDRRVLLFLNGLLYLFALIFASKGELLLWFGQKCPIPSASSLIQLTITLSATSLFFLERDNQKQPHGPLFTSIFLVLSLGILFSTDILRMSILLILFEVVELLTLSNNRGIQNPGLKDITLTKIFSIVSITASTVLIITARDSVSLLESNILNYNLFYLGICFFIMYLLSALYLPPLEEVKKTALLHSEKFTIATSVLSKFVILGVVLITSLKGFILSMEPYAQEELLSGIKVILFISLIALLLRSMAKRSKRETIYNLFCLNNILALFTIYSPEKANIHMTFFLLALSALGLFMGLYTQKSDDSFGDGRLQRTGFTLYLVGVIALWGVPMTTLFKVRYSLMEQVFFLDMTVLTLVIFMFVSAILWYPIVLSFQDKLKTRSSENPKGNIPPLETAGLIWLSIQIIILNYSNIFVD